MLDLQKEKVRLLCKRVKEADDYDAVQHRKYLDALKNVYPFLKMLFFFPSRNLAVKSLSMEL